MLCGVLCKSRLQDVVNGDGKQPDATAHSETSGIEHDFALIHLIFIAHASRSDLKAGFTDSIMFLCSLVFSDRRSELFKGCLSIDDRHARC